MEDEAAVLRAWRRILERLGYTVLSAAGPAAALQLAREHPASIDLLTTDVVMPEMSGWELYEALAEMPVLECLFVSGHSADVLAEGDALRPGIHFLRKPFDCQTLALKLREILDA